MASVDSPEESEVAQRLGWRTFRVRTSEQPLDKSEVVCPASNEAGHVAQCVTCRLCCGTERQAKSVAIIAHGSNATHFVPNCQGAIGAYRS